jgi:hypothetical protein
MRVSMTIIVAGVRTVVSVIRSVHLSELLRHLFTVFVLNPLTPPVPPHPPHEASLHHPFCLSLAFNLYLTSIRFRLFAYL